MSREFHWSQSYYRNFIQLSVISRDSIDDKWISWKLSILLQRIPLNSILFQGIALHSIVCWSLYYYWGFIEIFVVIIANFIDGKRIKLHHVVTLKRILYGIPLNYILYQWRISKQCLHRNRFCWSQNFYIHGILLKVEFYGTSCNYACGSIKE